jgi:hypothetical protein
MGRTLPRFSRLIEHERRAWTSFKRALRKADQAAFDCLFDCAKISPGGLPKILETTD